MLKNKRWNISSEMGYEKMGNGYFGIRLIVFLIYKIKIDEYIFNEDYLVIFK